MSEDVFSETNEVKSNWWKKETIGDKISGTFISKRKQINSLSGEEQNVYELMAEPNKDIWNIGGNAGIDSQMRNVKVGQIVGFKYIADKKSTKVGFNPTKVVQVYANPNLVDEEWLKSEDVMGLGGLGEEDLTKELKNL